MRWEYTKGVAEASAVTGARDVLSQSDKGFAKFAKDKVTEANENVFGTIESKSQAGAAQGTDISNIISWLYFMLLYFLLDIYYIFIV